MIAWLSQMPDQIMQPGSPLWDIVMDDDSPPRAAITGGGCETLACKLTLGSFAVLMLGGWLVMMWRFRVADKRRAAEQAERDRHWQARWGKSES